MGMLIRKFIRVAFKTYGASQKTMPVTFMSLFLKSRHYRLLSFAVGILESQGQVEQNDKLQMWVKEPGGKLSPLIFVDFLQPFWTFAVL